MDPLFLEPISKPCGGVENSVRGASKEAMASLYTSVKEGTLLVENVPTNEYFKPTEFAFGLTDNAPVALGLEA